MSLPLRIILAQLKFLVGDIENNLDKIKTATLLAKDKFKADVIVFSEMALTGYPPEDLLLRSELYAQVNLALQELAALSSDIYIVIGYPENHAMVRYNSAAVLYRGEVVANYRKQCLPNYGVFDEKRYFEPGIAPCVVDIKGAKVSISICEDLWFPEPMQKAVRAGANVAININASPFDLYKPFVREEVMGQRSREGKIPLLYVNCIGGQDELVFDGGSFVLNAQGEITGRGNFFQEELLVVDLEYTSNVKVYSADKMFAKRQGDGVGGILNIDDQFYQSGQQCGKSESFTNQDTECKDYKSAGYIPKEQYVLPIIGKEERAYNALVLGVRDYVTRNGFPGVIIGVSGGVDSALTLAIAVDAVGKEKVHVVFMPSRYTRDISGIDAKELADNLGVEYNEISIEPILKSFLESLKEEFGDNFIGTTEENLQARCRGTILMALSNKKNYIVLATGNKSEIAVGYSTLYGDMVGGFCVLKDVPKTLVYDLVNYRNSIAGKTMIPQRIIDRPPSAELKEDQLDIDSLPPYPVLDAILECYIEKNMSTEAIIKTGFDPNVVRKTVDMVNRNEYKRRQGPIGVRITSRAFGRDRRYPITSGFKY